MNNIVAKLELLIESGAKIHSVDTTSQKIRIIEGIEISEKQYKVLVSSNSVAFADEVTEYIQAEKFQNALFKPTIRGIILIDIADYSKGDTLYQAAILTIFNQVINRTLQHLTNISTEYAVEQVIPTGDGCYIVFNELLNDQFLLAVLIINSEMNVLQEQLLEKFSKDPDACDRLHIRVGCSLNETDFFYDAAGNRNCYGVGMNEAARILTYGQRTAENKFQGQNTFGSVFFDATVYEQGSRLYERLKKSSPELELIDLGEVADKHGLTRRIWWLQNLPKNLFTHQETFASN